MIKYYHTYDSRLREGNMSWCLEDKVPFQVIENRYVIKPRQRATAGAQAYVPIDSNAAILRVGFNSRKFAATISGDAVRWNYSDTHGQELVAVLAPGEFVMWVPGDHSHGPGQRFLGEVDENLNIKLTPLLPPKAKDVNLEEKKPFAVMDFMPVCGRLYSLRPLTIEEEDNLDLTGIPYYINPKKKNLIDFVESRGAIPAQRRWYYEKDSWNAGEKIIYVRTERWKDITTKQFKDYIVIYEITKLS